jgi:ribosomal protein S18 acetylase RimI-like enzyme
MERTTISHITQVTDQIIADINAVLDDGKIWDTHQGEKFLQDPNTILFVAYYGDNPAAFLYGYRLQRFDSRKAEVLLYEIAVLEAYRRKGIAIALVEKLKIWAADNEADEVWVLTNKSNEGGMALYSSCGGTIEADDEQMFTFKL